MSESAIGGHEQGSNRSEEPFFLARRRRASSTEQELWDRLDDIEDPHMPLSLVEMGMIYDVRFAAGEATVDMTFPCLGCPAYDMIQEDIEHALQQHEAVDTTTIDIVWDPVWSKDLLTAEVRSKLNEFGVGL